MRRNIIIMSFFEKIKNGLKNTKETMMKKIEEKFNVFIKIDEELFEELEEILIMSDVGAQTAMEICNQLRAKVKKQGSKDGLEVKNCLKEIIADNSLH